ncbi:ribosomal protein S29 [Chloropicon primus]|nr:ribosomal protein S29 [Chloropicon primus]
MTTSLAIRAQPTGLRRGLGLGGGGLGLGGQREFGSTPTPTPDAAARNRFGYTAARRNKEGTHSLSLSPSPWDGKRRSDGRSLHRRQGQGLGLTRGFAASGAPEPPVGKKAKGGNTEGKGKAEKKAHAVSLQDVLGEVVEGATGAKSKIFKAKNPYPPLNLEDIAQGAKRSKGGQQGSLLPEGLPKGLGMELLGGPQVTCRPEMISFLRDVLSEEGHRKYLVDGGKGTGKSILLALLVAVARLNGWVVAYLPSATRVVQGGRFRLDEQTGLWENPDVAVEILQNIGTAHGAQLEELGLKHLLLAEGADSEAAQGDGGDQQAEEDSTQKLVDLLTGLASQDKYPFMVCADDYNALFGETGYTDYSDRPLSPHDLKLVCAFRWLERPEVKRGVVVAASSATVPVRKTVKIPETGDVSHVSLNPISYEEACAMWSKHGLEQPKQRSKEEQVLRNFVLGVNGDGHAIRDYSAML